VHEDLLLGDSLGSSMWKTQNKMDESVPLLWSFGRVQQYHAVFVEQPVLLAAS
jgi:hypothetical protein